MEEEKKTNELKEVTKELIGWEDNKLFLTLNHLTTRPAEIVTAYCKGERNKYLSPIVYCFGVTALNAYLFSASGLVDATLNSNPIASAFGIEQKLSSETAEVFSFLLSDTGQKIVFLPMMMLVTWLLYKKYNGSFKENCWFTLYIQGHGTLLATPLILYYYLTKDIKLYGAVNSLIGIAYWVWASKLFYSISFLRAIFLQVIWSVSIILTFGILSGLGAFIFFTFF